MKTPDEGSRTAQTGAELFITAAEYPGWPLHSWKTNSQRKRSCELPAEGEEEDRPQRRPLPGQQYQE